MGYTLDPSTDDCYEGTYCLVNNFGIRDEKLLAEVESKITLARISLLEQNPIKGRFDFEHYKAIHRFIFEELYEWAGTVRKSIISKKGTRFVPADEIESVAKSCFDRLKHADYFRDQSKEEFEESIADFYNTTNMLHPFREGNGRTQRVFIEQLIRFNGYEFSFADIDSDELMIATIQAANGVDGYLKDIFREALANDDID